MAISSKTILTVAILASAGLLTVQSASATPNTGSTSTGGTTAQQDAMSSRSVAAGSGTGAKASTGAALSAENPDVRSGAKAGISSTIGAPKTKGQSEFSTHPFVSPDKTKIVK